MNISGPAAVAKPEMLFYAPGDLTVTFHGAESSATFLVYVAAILRYEPIFTQPLGFIC